MANMTGATLLELDNVTKRFGEHVAVDHLTMNVQQGEIVALLGRTGAGKSTVMGLLMGSISCDEGGVRVAGHDPSRDFQALRGKMSVSFQTDRLLPWRSAVENVELGMQILNFPKDKIRPTAVEWLRRVNLNGAEDKYVHELSGGMRQRVSLARALAVDPELLLLDESFSQLDHVTSQVLRRDFAQIVREYGKTCVFVTHRIDDALEMADRIFVLAAPARVKLEIVLNAADRANPARMAGIHEEIAAAIGAGPDE
ncbi:MAG: transporter [Paucimonas sp.]|jgi:NitT/TauT family transport system ATP-binding protein|nr:transporter [Paucimonas sp.]